LIAFRVGSHRRRDLQYLPPIATDVSDARRRSPVPALLAPQQMTPYQHHHLPSAAVVPPIAHEQWPFATAAPHSGGADNSSQSRSGLKRISFSSLYIGRVSDIRRTLRSRIII